MTKSSQVLFSTGLGLSQNTKIRVSAALVSCRRASLPNCSLMQQKAEQRDFRHAVLSKLDKPVLCAATLLETAFAEVSNMTFYHKLTNSCYYTNMPGKTNHRFAAICFPYSLFIFSGNTDILQVLRALRSDGSAACGDTPSCTDLDNIVDLSLGQQRLLP